MAEISLPLLCLALGVLGQCLFTALLVRPEWTRRRTEPPKAPRFDLPHITVQMPKYSCDLGGIVKPTIEALESAMARYEKEKSWPHDHGARQDGGIRPWTRTPTPPKHQAMKPNHRREQQQPDPLLSPDMKLPPENHWCEEAAIISSTHSRSRARHRARRRILTTLVCDTATTTVAGISAIVMSRVRDTQRASEPTNGEVGWEPEEETPTGFPALLSALADPRPWMGIVAIATYGIAMGLRYHSHRDERHQDTALALACVLGVGGGLLTSLEPQDILFQVLPGLALAFLVVSSFVSHGLGHVRSAKPM